MKSPPAKVTGNKRWHLLKLQQLSSHCRSDYFGEFKLVRSKQNRSQILFAKNWSQQLTSYHVLKKQPTLFKTCNLYSRHRKVSIPASLVSNNVKPGFHVIVPQLHHPNSQDRRLLGCINHDIPNSQFSKTCKCSDHHSSITGCYKIPKSQICRPSRSINYDVTESRDHKIAHIPMS